jgi:translation initiation factor 2-alpha kinase 3
VSASTGAVLYECRVNECKNETVYKEYLKQDVLIIQRFQQTIRAVEARTGIER